MKSFIIGKGFDLHHGLHTSYLYIKMSLNEEAVNDVSLYYMRMLQIGQIDFLRGIDGEVGLKD